MQLGLVPLVMVILGYVGHSDGLKLSKGRRQRRISTEGPPSCSSGCERCSEYNGCFKCRPRLFMLLERNDIRQIGVCLASCPVGYYGMRNPDTNRCIQCRIDNCEACFNRNFCTKCKEGLYSHRGRCHLSCPEGLSTTNGTMECVECELGEWSPWGPCMKNEKTCGFKKGTQTRVREPLQTPSQTRVREPVQSPSQTRVRESVQAPSQTRVRESVQAPSQTRVREPVQASSPETFSSVVMQPCAPQTETQKCIVQRTPCGKDRKGKGERRDEQRKRDKENGGRGRGREGKESGKGGTRRRKGQNRATTAPSLTARPSTVT